MVRKKPKVRETDYILDALEEGERKMRVGPVTISLVECDIPPYFRIVFRHKDGRWYDRLVDDANDTVANVKREAKRFDHIWGALFE